MYRSKNECPFYFFLFSFYFLLIITLLSCTTQPQSGLLSGTINLENEQDHSGIVVGVYKLATLDPDIVEANQKWPHIGVIINQHTEFDHRFGTLIKTGETDASGYFEINDIPTGVYNVVAIKDSFGFHYIYNVQINEGSNSLSNFTFYILHFTLDSKNETAKADLTLYPETIINFDISTPTTFESFHHYIIEQDIIIDDELTIEPGAVIRLNEGVKMSIYGDLTAVGQEDNFIWFTSNDRLFLPLTFYLLSSPPKSDIALYNKIELEGNPDKEVAWCKFDWANIGLLNHINGFEILDCIFRESQCGFKAENVDSTFCKNLLCEEIDNEEQGGIYFMTVDDGLIEKSIVNDCKNGMKIKDHTSPQISNNIFINNYIGAFILLYNGDFFHNDFDNNNLDLQISGWFEPFPNVLLNNFNSKIGINFSCISSGAYWHSNAIIHNNNFNNASYLIRVEWQGQNANYEIDATNNYFGLFNLDLIKEKILDKEDYDPEIQPSVPSVLVDEFLFNPVYNAGIE